MSRELEAACDVLIWSALSVAGQRVTRTSTFRRSQRSAARDIPYDHMHTAYPIDSRDVDQRKLLVGAWDRVPEIAERYGADSFLLTAALDEYTRGLIAARMPHTFEEVQRMLRRINWAGYSVPVYRNAAGKVCISG